MNLKPVNSDYNTTMNEQENAPELRLFSMGIDARLCCRVVLLSREWVEVSIVPPPDGWPRPGQVTFAIPYDDVPAVRRFPNQIVWLNTQTDPWSYVEPE